MNPRKHILSSGREILLGRDSKNNDELVKSAKRNETLLHTEAPGSPFCLVGVDPSKAEISEAAIVCAKYSQDWRNNKRDVIVNKFLRADMKKGFFTKEGTWKVKKSKKLKAKKTSILKLEKNIKNKSK